MALTPDELRAHAGEMLRQAFTLQQFINALPEGAWVRLAVWYVKNASYGTAADRKEAMRAMMRIVFEAKQGMDPVPELHTYKNHWLDIHDPTAVTELGE